MNAVGGSIFVEDQLNTYVSQRHNNVGLETELNRALRNRFDAPKKPIDVTAIMNSAGKLSYAEQHSIDRLVDRLEAAGDTSTDPLKAAVTRAASERDAELTPAVEALSAKSSRRWKRSFFGGTALYGGALAAILAFPPVAVAVGAIAGFGLLFGGTHSALSLIDKARELVKSYGVND